MWTAAAVGMLPGTTPRPIAPRAQRPDMDSGGRPLAPTALAIMSKDAKNSLAISAAGGMQRIFVGHLRDRQWSNRDRCASRRPQNPYARLVVRSRLVVMSHLTVRIAVKSAGCRLVRLRLVWDSITARWFARLIQSRSVKIKQDQFNGESS
jgi:hypothetical protein